MKLIILVSQSYLFYIVLFFLVSPFDCLADVNNSETKQLDSGVELINEVYSQSEELSQSSLDEVINYLEKLKNDNRFKSKYLQVFLDIQLASFYRDFDFEKGQRVLKSVVSKIKYMDWPYLKSIYLLELNVQQRLLGKCDGLQKNNDSINNLLLSISSDFRSKIKIENILDRVSIFICLENYSKAIEWLTENEKLFIDNQIDISTKLYYLNQMGNLHTQVGSYQVALKYYFEVLEILEVEKLNDLYFASVYNSLGAIYYMMNDINNSLIYLSKAETIYLNQNVNDDQLAFLYNLCELYLGLKQPQKALATAQKMLLNASGMDLFTAMANYQIYQAHFVINNQIELQDLDKAIEIFKKNNTTDYFLSSLELKAKILLKKGDYEQASNVLLFRAHIKDSLISKEKISSLQNLLIKYETDKKDNLLKLSGKQKELDDLEISQQKEFIIYLFAFILVITFSFFLLIRSIQQKNQFKRLELRSKLTRAQFNPHFINNAFASMQSMVVMEQDSEKLIDYISGVSRFSRLMLESTFNDEWTLQNEIEFSEYFLKIQSVRFEDKLNYSFDFLIPEYSSVLVPCAIFQPVIENAIEHSGIGQRDAYIQVEINIKDGSVAFSMRNSVKSIKTVEMKRKSNEPSRGIDIVKQRINLHSIIYKKKSSFNFEILDGVAVTEIKLPIINQ